MVDLLLILFLLSLAGFFLQSGYDLWFQKNTPVPKWLRLSHVFFFLIPLSIFLYFFRRGHM